MEIHGQIAPGFERVAESFAANFEGGGELGASFAAIRDGATLVHIWAGHADRAQTRPWTQDTLAPVYSATKGVSALVVARAVSMGALSYDDRVCALWPAFGAEGKGQLTIAQALSHQAGVPGFVDPVDPAIWLDPPACAHAIAALAPLWPPGSASGYHPYTWGYIVAELVQRATGRSVGAHLRDICAARGIDFHLGLAESEDARCADIVKPRRIADFGEMTPAKRAAFFQPWSAPQRADAAWRRVEIPSANGHATALALAQLYAIYAQDGDGMLSPDAFAGLIARQSFGQDLVLPFRIDWRAGVLGNNNAFYGPNPDALGHSGSGGSCGFADPARRLSGAYVMNKQSEHIMGDPRALRLIAALYQCLDA